MAVNFDLYRKSLVNVLKANNAFEKEDDQLILYPEKVLTRANFIVNLLPLMDFFYARSAKHNVLAGLCGDEPSFTLLNYFTSRQASDGIYINGDTIYGDPVATKYFFLAFYLKDKKQYKELLQKLPENSRIVSSFVLICDDAIYNDVAGDFNLNCVFRGSELLSMAKPISIENKKIEETKMINKLKEVGEIKEEFVDTENIVEVQKHLEKVKNKFNKTKK